MLKRIIACLLCFTAVLPLTACAETDPPPADTSAETDPAAVTDTWELLQAALRQNIDENLALLVPEDNLLRTETDWIAANPDAFETIVSCGESALPYLTELACQAKIYDSSIENYRRYMAKYAAYTIRPSLYERTYPSPDWKYVATLAPTSFVTEWDPFMGTEYLLTVSDTETGTVIVSAEDLCVIPSEEMPILWSPDGKYALLSQSYRHAITSLHVVDTQSAVYYALPHKAELETILGKELVYHDTEMNIALDNLHLSLGAWGDGTITVSLALSSSVGGSVIAGEYTYNLENRTIVDINIEVGLATTKPGETESGTQISPVYQSFYTETDGYGVSAHTGAAGMEFHYFYTTSDAGKTWTEMETNLDTVYPCVITGISFKDESVGFIVYRHWDASFAPPVIKTVDGGKTWERQTNICELLKEYTEQQYSLTATPPQFHEDGRCTMDIKGIRHNDGTDTDDVVYLTIESTDCETWMKK